MYVWNRVREDPSLILEGVRHPRRVLLELTKTYYQMSQGNKYNTTGTDIFDDEDWDNLIILDACRYDAYIDATPFDNPVGYRTSAGSASPQFIRGNFGKKELHDVVYISGNQWFLRLEDELDCELHYYHDVERDVMDGYVPSPGAVTSVARRLANDFSNKRLVVHYMQPHKPYLSTHRELFTYKGALEKTMRVSEANNQQLRTAYRANLDLVLEHVQELLPHLEGKTVISSDHGELLGERVRPFFFNMYGHPRAVYVDTLITVPWHVVSEGPRKEIIPEPSVGTNRATDQRQVESTLRELGYL